MYPTWDRYKCIGCVACVGSCPEGALRFSNGSIHVIKETCVECLKCTLICPVGALSGGE